MASRVFVRTEIIDGEQLDVRNIRCPACGSNTLVLSGQSQVPLREIVQEGVVVERLEGQFEDGAFDLEQIDCIACSTSFVIHDHQLYTLERENLELRKQLTGGENVPNGYGFVN